MEKVLKYIVRRNYRKGRMEISLIMNLNVSSYINNDIIRDNQADIIGPIKVHLAEKLMEELNNVLGDYIRPRLAERLHTLEYMISKFQNCSRQKEYDPEGPFSVIEYELLKEHINLLVEEVMKANEPKPLNIAAIKTTIVEEDDERTNS